MKKFWLIFLNEYKRHVLRKRFIFAILSMPLFAALIILIGYVSVWLMFKDTPVGYIDLQGLLVNAQQVPAREKTFFKSVSSLPYSDEESAKIALQAGEIQAYFILSENYMSTGEVRQVSTSETAENASGDFGDFLTFNLLKDQPEPVIKRLTDGNNLIIRSLDGTREMEPDNWLSIALPILAGVLFAIAVNISGSYLLQAVVEEKENRTMEILVTSVSPDQLMAGKVIGNLCVGLTQLATWIVFAIIALNVATKFFPIGEAPKLDASYLLLMAATLLPAFVMVAAAMGAVGAMATEMREAQQITGWFTIPLMIPIWFISPIMFNPNGPLAVGMSLFPLTAPIALPLRAVFTTVPFWQIAMTVTLLCVIALFTLWLAARVFRLGMLRYGKRVSLREAFQRAK